MILERLVVTKRLASCSLTAALFLCASFAAQAQQPGGSTKPAPAELRTLPTDTEKWKGDFNGMLKRRQIRIVVPYSRTLFFNDKGRERGIIADNARDFERYINKKYRKKLRNRPITVYLIPTTRDLLLEKVVDGFADIAAGNLTVTDERKKLVDFVAPKDQKRVSELVVTGGKSPPLAGAEELSGKTVHVRKASSYYESLIAINSRLKKEGKRAAKLVLVPDARRSQGSAQRS
jgi:ABC-type amino acid transport substrate-binding protein